MVQHIKGRLKEIPSRTKIFWFGHGKLNFAVSVLGLVMLLSRLSYFYDYVHAVKPNEEINGYSLFFIFGNLIASYLCLERRWLWLPILYFPFEVVAWITLGEMEFKIYPPFMMMILQMIFLISLKFRKNHV